MTKAKEEKVIAKTPSGFSVVAREFKKDKGAFAALLTLSAILLFVVGFNIYIRVSGVYQTYFEVDLLNIFLKPGEDGFLLGTDVGGHSVFGWLIMGMLNSILIALAVTVITITVGTTIGLVIAYYGGAVDNIVMRFVDFMVIIPTLMVIIVFVSIKRDYGLVLFILILSVFAWMSSTRLVRSKALSESRRDYVKTARAKGVPVNKVYSGHIFRNSILPIAAFFGFSITGLFSGGIFVETIFGYPGMGQLFYQSILDRDYSVVTTLMLFSGFLTLLGSMLSDIIMAIVDPRIKLD